MQLSGGMRRCELNIPQQLTGSKLSFLHIFLSPYSPGLPYLFIISNPNLCYANKTKKFEQDACNCCCELGLTKTKSSFVSTVGISMGPCGCAGWLACVEGSSSTSGFRNGLHLCLPFVANVS